MYVYQIQIQKHLVDALYYLHSPRLPANTTPAVGTRDLRVDHRHGMSPAVKTAVKTLVMGIPVMAGHNRLERHALQRLQKA